MKYPTADVVCTGIAIYPIETLKTRLMSSTGGELAGNALLIATAKDMWRNGGVNLYFKGLTAGLVGVFPYSGGFRILGTAERS